MVAVLLYVVGLVATIATVVMVGFEAPAIIDQFTAGADVVATALRVARSLAWAVMPFAGGLVLMGLARIIMLLGSIDRALRGNP